MTVPTLENLTFKSFGLVYYSCCGLSESEMLLILGSLKQSSYAEKRREDRWGKWPAETKNNKFQLYPLADVCVIKGQNQTWWWGRIFRAEKLTTTLRLKQQNTLIG